LINPCYNEESFREWIEKEFPSYEVSCEAFELSQTLVTNKEAIRFLRECEIEIPESILLGLPGDHPVWGVSLDWAKRFADWKSDCHYRFRLPTEIEWEIAARGTDFREYPYGKKFDPQAANTVESCIGMTTPVDRYRDFAGPFGHYDLAGNVEEWVSSNYYVYPGGRLIEDDLFQRFGADYAILRGGSFCCGGDLSRSARRHGPFPDPLFRFTGFRLVREKIL
jgi:formylglycine-generating enzyme required for sulfatase activity